MLLRYLKSLIYNSVAELRTFIILLDYISTSANLKQTIEIFVVLIYMEIYLRTHT
ncbi:hypothetical protein HMPREF0645_2796 [Hallella bergensis DSM 17361]|uniref:Uncharacterized protein n=1 Tax=Hallella bergensis DSM 17361 TaxID=585502 RepID=D1Q0R1_9BACT|nr:hypothetical protein HMPREF0645_2796 [Hallella bergensis DSM 17361]